MHKRRPRLACVLVEQLWIATQGLFFKQYKFERFIRIVCCFVGYEYGGRNKVIALSSAQVGRSEKAGTIWLFLQEEL